MSDLLMVRGSARDPEPGVAYTRVLVEPGETPVRSVFGLLVVLVGYAVVLPLFSQAALGIAWLVRGKPGAFLDYQRSAVAYELPEGVAIGHAALALLIPMTLLAGWYIHRRRPKWLCSVQPGMRWRFLVMVAVVAVIVLNAILWLRGGVEINPASNLAMWLVLVTISSPLQAAGEEFLFRGYMMQTIGTLSRNPWVGVVASALVFAFLHGSQNLALFVDRFGFGMLAGSLVLLTGGLEASIAIHAVNNVLAFGYAALGGGLASARGLTQIGWAQAGWDLLSFALCGVVAWWIGRRLNVATRTPDVA